LDPHEVTLIVNDRATFEQRYGEDLPTAGEYTDSKLSNVPELGSHRSGRLRWKCQRSPSMASQRTSWWNA
jgi:hypothetical protein